VVEHLELDRRQVDRDPLVDNCIPNCALGKESYHHLYVTLSGVKYHNGRAYYSQMTWYTPGYRTFGSHGSTLVLHVNGGGFWS
jgi:hypothetical protein